MAWRWHLNMEPVSLAIVESSLLSMTDTNYNESFEGEDSELYSLPDLLSFENNLHHGFIVVTMLSCYFETSLNTLLRDYLGYAPNGFLIKSGIEQKLEVIFSEFKDELTKLKSTSQWRDSQRIIKARNHLIHYKENSSSIDASWPPISHWKIGNETLGEFFTRLQMQICSNAVKKLIEDIAAVLNLRINPALRAVDCGARFGVVSSFCTEEDFRRIEEELSDEIVHQNLHEG